MCTAITFKSKHFYFGRTLDYSHGFKEEIVIVPRNFHFVFKEAKTIKQHYAMIGMATVADNFPLFFDACNEKGLAIAALNFIGNAKYNKEVAGKENVATYELIPYLLGTCSTVKEALEKMKNVNITDVPFNKIYDVGQLHWILTDDQESVTIEAIETGIKIYANPVGILTNNPTFDMQLFQLNNYIQLSSMPPQNNFLKDVPVKEYSYGMGAIGLPGDYSSQSRFVRATFVKMNSIPSEDEIQSVNQFFHILESVSQPKGCVRTTDDDCITTLYTSCYNTETGIYYYNSYNNHQLHAISMHKVNLNTQQMYRYHTVNSERIKYQN